MSRPQNNCPTLLQPETSPLGPQKDKNNPKIKSNSNVRIQGIIENESCSNIWVDTQKQFLSIEPKNSPLGPIKVKNNNKIKSNQMSELKETKKIKIFAL